MEGAVAGAKLVATISMMGEGARPVLLMPVPRSRLLAREDRRLLGPATVLFSSVPEGEGRES